MKSLLLDTSGIYALVDASDKNHGRAKQFLTEWFQGGGTVIVTDSVFSESMTLIKARIGVEKAIEVGRTLRGAALYHWTPLTPEDEANAWAVLQKYVDKEWSYVDCGLYVIAQRLGVSIFAFDHHFDQMAKIKRVPQ